MAAHIVLPWVHRIFSNLKIWALGVYHGLRRKYLQSYLDEFVFRFNRRRTRHAAFRSLIGIAAGHQPFPYKMLISPEEGFRSTYIMVNPHRCYVSNHKQFDDQQQCSCRFGGGRT